MTEDSAEYLQRKEFYNRMLTVYGRKPVLEVLQDNSLEIHKLHLAESNKPAAILDDMVKLAKKRGIEVCYHDKQALSRISKNSKQDQGVAADVIGKGFQSHQSFLSSNKKHYRILALDGVTNPQNVGMIIRSACASPIDAIILPEKGCAKLDPLVIKASTGTLFRAPILRCKTLASCLKAFAESGADIIGLDANAPHTLGEEPLTGAKVFVLGNETEGLSSDVRAICNKHVSIPMLNNVESLNVAVTASLIAFQGALQSAL